MQEETGATPEEVTRAFILVRDIFGLDAALARASTRSTTRSPRSVQYEMLIDVGRLVVRGDALVPAPAPREAADRRRCSTIFRPALAALARAAAGRSSRRGDRAACDAAVARLAAEGVPQPSSPSGWPSSTRSMRCSTSSEVAVEQKKGVELIGALYFALVGELELRWFAAKITRCPPTRTWQALARNALRDDLASQQRALASTVAKLSPECAEPAQMLAVWKERYAPAIAR